MLWGYGIAEGEAAVRAALLPDGLDHDDDRDGERRLRALAAAAPPRALRAHVRRRLGRLDRWLDQGRPPPAARQGPPPRGRSDAEPGGRHADPTQRRTRRRADDPRDRVVHPPVRRHLGRRRVDRSRSTRRSPASASARSTPSTASATTLGNVGPGFGIAGPYGSFAEYGDVSKITMIGLMWVGRLEIIPVVVLLTRHYWRLVGGALPRAPRIARAEEHARRSAVAVGTTAST